MATKVAVVTGSNKGIGLAIVRALCKQFTGDVILTARSVENGMAAIEELKKEGLNPKFHQLDVTDKASIEALKTFLVSNYGGLDVLVNNAGVAARDSAVNEGERAEAILRTNFWAVIDVCASLFPILRPHARVVHVSSTTCFMALTKCTEEVRKRIFACASYDDVKKLMTEYERLVKEGKHEENGWPIFSYGVSKIGVTCLTILQQKEFDMDSTRPDIVVNAICPGFVATDMTVGVTIGSRTPLTPDEGADTPVYCALLPPNVESPRGVFVSERTVKEWTYDPSIDEPIRVSK